MIKLNKWEYKHIINMLESANESLTKSVNQIQHRYPGDITTDLPVISAQKNIKDVITGLKEKEPDSSDPAK